MSVSISARCEGEDTLGCAPICVWYTSHPSCVCNIGWLQRLGVETISYQLPVYFWSVHAIRFVLDFAPLTTEKTELDVRTQLDSREYFEVRIQFLCWLCMTNLVIFKLPAFLLGTLIYAFWLSFSDVGVSNVSPTTWPLAWLVLALLVLLNPLPVLFPSSRRWCVQYI